MSCCTTIDLSVVIMLLVNISAGDTCTVTIKDDETGTEPVIDGLIGVQCVISSCDNISKVVFYKEDEAVYEGKSRSDHRALNTDAAYNLAGRVVEYLAFSSVHSLYIEPVILQDHGIWRCAVFTANDEYQSDQVTINIYAKPKDEDILKNKSSSQYVTDRPQTFTCEVKDVHPEPTLTLTLNVEQQDGARGDRVQSDNGLWSVRSTFEHTFTKSGIVTLECVMSAGDRQAWIKDEINIDVKESAKVIRTTYPREHVLPNATFTLTCVGSGYGHRITWKKDGNLIRNGEIYDIQGCETAQYKKCTSTVRSRPVKEESECYKMYDYTGKYTCIVQLDTPYNSKDERPEMKIQVSNTPAQLGTPENTTVTRCTKERQIHCPVCATEVATDTWYYGDTKLDKDDVDGTISSNELAFGMYKRAVKTSGGHINVTVHLLEGGYELCTYEKVGIVIGVLFVGLVIAAIVGVVCYMVKRMKTGKSRKFCRVPANEQSPPVDDKTKAASPNETVACESGPVYVYKSGAPTQAPPLEAIYSQVNKPKKGQVVPEPTKANDPDELHYAEVEVIKGKNRKKKQSPKTPNPVYEPTEYASIDHTKSAKPDGP